MIECSIYARDSTDQQGDTLDNQIEQCKEYIRRLGFSVKEENIFKDHAISGYYTSVFDREAMKEAVAAAKEGRFKVIVFKEISRVGRDKQENPAIVGIFEQFGVRVIAINDNYDTINKDNITFDILSVLSEQESKKTSVRVSSGKIQKARRGRWNTDAPIGYNLNSTKQILEVDPERKGTIELIFSLYTQRGLGSFLIAKQLNDKGEKTRDGNLFSRESVKRVLKNRAYIGDTVYGKKRNELKREYDDMGRMTKSKVQVKIDEKDWIIVEGTHEPIIDKETFYAAQLILAGRGHHRTPRRAYHPLTGILFCGKCGEGMVCQKRSYKEKEYRYYICKTYHKYGRDACPQANIEAQSIENQVEARVKQDLFNQPTNQIGAKKNRSGDIGRLEKDLKERAKAKDKLQKDQVDIFEQRELFDSETYKGKMLELKRVLQTVEDEMVLMDKQLKAIVSEATQNADIEGIIKDYLTLDGTDPERSRAILHKLVTKIDVKENVLDIEYRYDII